MWKRIATDLKPAAARRASSTRTIGLRRAAAGVPAATWKAGTGRIVVRSRLTLARGPAKPVRYALPCPAVPESIHLSGQSMTQASAGARLRAALDAERPLQVVGADQRLRGAAGASGPGFKRAVPLRRRRGQRLLRPAGPGHDLARTMSARTSAASPAPASCRCWSMPTPAGARAFNIARTVQELIRAGAGGMHLEDQVAAKRCGHRPGKELVPAAEMCDRIKAAVDGRTDARVRHHGAHRCARGRRPAGGARARARAYVEAGADMIFAEALTTLDEYRQFTARGAGAGARQHHRVRPDAAVHRRRSWRGAGVRLVLYPAVRVPRR